MRDQQFPLFSGPGHILMFYCFIAIIIGEPTIVQARENYVYILGAFASLGFPIGSIINILYFAIWNWVRGYTRVGHSRKYVTLFKGVLDRDTISAVHDKMLWELASPHSIEYFRRRWAHFHFLLQVAIVSCLGLAAPFIVALYGDNLGHIMSTWPLYVYSVSLLVIVTLAILTAGRLAKHIRIFIGELFEGHEERFCERLTQLSVDKSVPKCEAELVYGSSNSSSRQKFQDQGTD